MAKAKKKRNRMSIPGMVFLGIFLVVFFTAIIVAGYFFYEVNSRINGDLIINLDEYKANQNQTSFIFGTQANGEVIELARLHGEEDRVWVDLDDMSPYMGDAVIALEDTRFRQHHGVDWQRLGGIILKPEQLGQGGSTITQQLIKNLTNKKDVTVVRKFNEILTALNLERYYDKNTILEAYLNTAYFGSGCYGVKTASEKYFGKDVSELNAAECAVIVSITKTPTANNPLLHPDNNRTRQLYCLKQMYAEGNGTLTKEEYDEAVNYELIFTNSEKYVPSEEEVSKLKEEEKINSFYVDYVIQSVRDDLMKEYGYTKQQATDRIYYGGLQIYAAVDLDMQETLEKYYTNRKNFPDLGVDSHGDPVQSSMTIMDYQGRVLAIVGQIGEKKQNRGLNRAANSYRQPGSTIKPLATYAPAIELGLINYSSKVKDYAIAYNGELWPHNVDKTLGSGSNVLMEYAIQQSLNTVPARIIKDTLGVDTSFEFLRDKFHFSHLDETKDRALSPLAIGSLTHGTNTVEMAAAYATFGNGGLYYYPYSYYKVTNSQGTQVILSNEQPKNDRAISAETSDIICELLQTVSTQYYGTASNVRRFQIMAKTGTTSSQRDRWFCCGTPYYVASVWVGFDQEKYLSAVINPAGEIMFDVFDMLHKGLPEKEFPKSSGVVQKTYCRITGKLAGRGCYSTAKGWYKLTDLPGTCTYCSYSSYSGDDDDSGSSNRRSNSGGGNNNNSGGGGIVSGILDAISGNN